MVFNSYSLFISISIKPIVPSQPRRKIPCKCHANPSLSGFRTLPAPSTKDTPDHLRTPKESSHRHIVRDKTLSLRKTSDDMTITPSTLRKRSLAEELAERLQTQIGEGRFRTGEKLPPEPELMRLFGVGRSTVRHPLRSGIPAGTPGSRHIRGKGGRIVLGRAAHETRRHP